MYGLFSRESGPFFRVGKARPTRKRRVSVLDSYRDKVRLQAPVKLRKRRIIL